MQPHSITALAVAKHIFAQNYGMKIPKSAEVQIDWKTTDGVSRSIFHYVSEIKISKKDKNGYVTEIKVTVRTTDGTPCTLTILRRSEGEFKQGEKVIATHSVQHIAGLEEQYELSRSSIRGIHRHSWKYGDYVCNDSNEGSFTLVCTVRKGNTNEFMKIPYKVKVKLHDEEYTQEIAERERKSAEDKKKVEPSE